MENLSKIQNTSGLIFIEIYIGNIQYIKKMYLSIKDVHYNTLLFRFDNVSKNT